MTTEFMHQDSEDLENIISAYRDGYAFNRLVEKISESWAASGRICERAPEHYPLEQCPIPAQTEALRLRLIQELKLERTKG